MKKICRDFSNGSMKNLWCNMLPEQKSCTVSSGLNKTEAINKGEMTPIACLSNNIEINLDSESRATQNSGEKKITSQNNTQSKITPNSTININSKSSDKEYYQVNNPGSKNYQYDMNNSASKKPPTCSKLESIRETPSRRSTSKVQNQETNLKEQDDGEELATFLALESAIQKEVLKEDAFEVDDIAIDSSNQHPYFIQNLLNVMNNRKVCQNSNLNSCERSTERGIEEIKGPIYSSIRIDQNPKIQNLKNERLDKSPIMKYLSISIVKENTQNVHNNDDYYHKRTEVSKESRLKTPTTISEIKEKSYKGAGTRKKQESSKGVENTIKGKHKKEESKDSKLNMHSFKNKQLAHKASTSQNVGRGSNLKNRPGTTIINLKKRENSEEAEIKMQGTIFSQNLYLRKK